MSRGSKKREGAKAIARERITILFDLAARDPSRADRYVELARKIGERCRVPIPTHLKRVYCPRCHAYLPSNRRVRLHKGVITITCLRCGAIRRIPIGKG